MVRPQVINPKATVLAVDDVPANLDLLSGLLTSHDYRVLTATNGALAVKVALETPLDLILLDVNMPNMDGYEVCALLKADERTRPIPVIFVSSLDETDCKVRAFQYGAVDYVTKPFHLDEVLARVDTHIRLYQQQRQIEDLRRREKQHFDHLNALKDELLRSLSHDLKNPLNSVMGFAYLLEDDPASMPPEQIADFSRRIARGADKILSLVTELLDLDRIEAGLPLSLKPTPLNDYLQAHITDLEMVAYRKRISLVYEGASRDLVARLDAVRFGQAIDNLLGNAIKYTPEGGCVRLRLNTTERQARIEVIDNGLGIPEQDLPHIFDRFYRGSAEAQSGIEGTGLGLAIAQAIVQQHGGRIWAESQVGIGSTFTIELPLEPHQTGSTRQSGQ